MSKDDYVFLTDSGKVYTLTGTRLDKTTGKPIRGAPRLANPPQKHRGGNKVSPQSGNFSRRGARKGEDKYTAKVSVNPLKGTDKFVVNGLLDCNYPKLGSQCFTKLSMTCDTKEYAQRVSKIYKDYFQNFIDNFVKGWY
jgi:hypothetical protein